MRELSEEAIDEIRELIIEILEVRVPEIIEEREAARRREEIEASWQ
jgi:hypothetical protein